MLVNNEKKNDTYMCRQPERDGGILSGRLISRR